MTRDYRVPKRRVEAELVLVGGDPRPVQLFLARRAPRRAGPERPGDLLNEADDPFFPVERPDGGVSLVQRAAVLLLSVPATAEPGREVEPDPAAGDGRGDVDRFDATPAGGELRVSMEDGRVVSGSVRETMPPGVRRVQDFLNRADAFFPLRDGDRIHFVNRSRVASVRRT